LRRFFIYHFVKKSPLVCAKVCEQEREQTREATACRLTSLNPSASFLVRGGGGSKDDGTRYRPLRSASMRETSYSRSIRKRFTLPLFHNLERKNGPISKSGAEHWPPFQNLERIIGPISTSGTEHCLQNLERTLIIP
jgi:hypothetical protein